MNSNEITPYVAPVASLMEMRTDPKRFPRLRSYPQDKAVDLLKAIVLKAFLYRGQNATDLDFIAENLYTELMEDTYGTASLTLGEIHHVVKTAVLGGSEMFGVNVASLYRVLAEYAKGEGHLLEVEAQKVRKAEGAQRLRESSAATMINVYAHRLINNNK